MQISIPHFKSKYLLLIISILGAFILSIFHFLPSYTKLALVFLFLPMMFFILRKEERLDEKRYFFILGCSIFATIFYDIMAQNVWLWRFPKESVSFWIFGIPLEEYIFGFWFPSIILGIYTSLPAKRIRRGIFDNLPHISEPVLLGVIFILELVVGATLLSSPASYFRWLLFIAILPSMFYFWRKRERIDENRLFLTLLIMFAVIFVIDPIFIPAGAWYYNEQALIGRIGIVPIDDILFTIFNAILIVGFYTSLPRNRILLGKE